MPTESVNCADQYIWEKIDGHRMNSFVPSSRNSCSWVTYGDVLYIFGGFTFNGRLDDIHEFNFETYHWSKVTTSGIKPTARENNGAILYKDHMYIFGGYDGQSWLNDFYQLNLKTLMWSKIDQKGTYLMPIINTFLGQQPSERFGFACGQYDSKMCVFAGFDGNQQLNDSFIWDFELRVYLFIFYDVY